MPKRKNPVQLEPLRVVRRETYEDDENYYVVEYYNRGGKNTDIHPKHPEIPKEKLLNEIVAPMLIKAWNRPSVQKRIAEQRAAERNELQDVNCSEEALN